MKQQKNISADEMLVRMAGLCAGAEQCAADIRVKILKKGFSAQQTDSMITYLQTNGYIDDNRFAKAYTSDKVRFSGWGHHKVRMGLRAKGISDAVISEAMTYVSEEDYIGTFEKVLKAKARSLDLSEVKDRQKLYRHMASRGFESALIISAIRREMSKTREPD